MRFPSAKACQRSQKITHILVGLIGVALVAFGLYALFAIHEVVTLTGLQPEGMAGLSEARAIYAGLFVALGAILLQGLWSPAVRPAFWMAGGIIFGGFVVARLLSILMDGYDPQLNALASEILVTIILLVAGMGNKGFQTRG